MASARITLSVDREHYRAAKATAARLDTTVSHLTDLFFQTMASESQAPVHSKIAKFRGAFKCESSNVNKALVSGLKAKHLR